MSRIASFDAFWPYYVSEHRHPWCRRLHFIGTSGFVGSVALSLATTPWTTLPALLVIGGVSRGFFQMDATRSAAPVLLTLVAVGALANPAMLGGVLFAYFFAWTAHFLVEHNRPATFTYPLWSLAGDFKMYGQMWRGRMWSGDGADGLI